MDPLSTTASILTVLRAANYVASLCCDYAAAIKGSSWGLTRIRDEIRDLRNVLESLEQISRAADGRDSDAAFRLPQLRSLCDPSQGPLASCLAELERLSTKLNTPKWAQHDRSKRAAIMQSLSWPLKENEMEKTLLTIGRFKSTLSLAISADQFPPVPDQGLTVEWDFDTSNTDDKKREIIDWLSAPDPSINHNAALNKRCSATGQWFLKCERFLHWKTAQNPILWLHGILGCGKTTLTSSIIESVSLDEPEAAVAYFYFDLNNSEKQTHDSMIRSLLLQLSFWGNNNSAPLRNLFTSFQDGRRQPSTVALEQTLKVTIEMTGPTYIIVDALDEATDQNLVQTFLESAQFWNPEDLRFFITSRNEKAIDDFFSSKFDHCCRFSIEAHNVGEDIRSSIKDRLQIDAAFRRWNKRPEVQQEIESKLLQKAGGMFRWVACQLDALSDCYNFDSLRKALDSLPATLDETYERILAKINCHFRSEVRQILQWLAFSKRPLSLDELADTIAFDCNEGFRFRAEKRFADPEEILYLCSSLVTTIPSQKAQATSEFEPNHWSGIATQESRCILLAHASVKDFLTLDRIKKGSTSFYSIERSAAHSVIAKTSLACLLSFRKEDHTSAQDFVEEFPLATYAAQYWTWHASLDHHQAEPLARELFESNNKFWNWITLYDLDEQLPKNGTHRADSEGGALYYAVLTGLPRVVRQLIEAKDDSIPQAEPAIENGLATKPPWSARKAFVNQKGGRLDTPLQAGSRCGSLEIVAMLLEHGADANLYGGMGDGSALSSAARGGFIDVAELLIASGAALDCDRYPLAQSSHIGEGEKVSMVATQVPPDLGCHADHSTGANETFSPGASEIDRLARIQMQYSPLFVASTFGNTKMVAFLLSKGANKDLSNSESGQTALCKAAWNGHHGVVKALVEVGADINKRDLYGRSPLLMAVMSQRRSIVDYLVQNGAQIDTSDDHGKTPLLEALTHNDEELLCTLLEAGVDVNQLGQHGNSPLRAAVVTGFAIGVQLLLAYGADVNQNVPLLEALRRRRIDIVTLLLDHGADVNVAQSFTHEDGVPLWLQCQLSTRAIGQNLCDLFSISISSIRPVPIQRPDQHKMLWKDTPLWVAAATGCFEIVQRLLQMGAATDEVSGSEIDSMTPLEMAAAEDHVEIVALLLGAGASIRERESFSEQQSLLLLKEPDQTMLNWFLLMDDEKTQYYMASPNLSQVELVSNLAIYSYVDE